MRDQRKFERVRFEEEVVVVIVGEQVSLIGEARDISIGGMFIDIAPIPFGTRVIVRLYPPGELHAIEIPGIVRWNRDQGVGVQFWLLGVRETHALTEIVAGAEPRATASRAIA